MKQQQTTNNHTISTAGFDSPWGHQDGIHQNTNALATSVKNNVAGNVAERLLFSCEDGDLTSCKWQINRWGYPVRTATIDGRYGCYYAHLIVMQRVLGRKTTPPKEQVDHRNGNKLDVRRENLRIVTPIQNAQARDRGPFSGTTRHHRGKWVAYVWINYKRTHLGLFADRAEAAAVAAAKRKELGFLERDEVPV